MEGSEPEAADFTASGQPEELGSVQTSSAQGKMDTSATEYVEVSSPYTFHVSSKGSPQTALTPTRLRPASWKRSPVSEGSVGSELCDSWDSELERMILGGEYQVVVIRQRVHASDELVGLSAEEMENDSLEEDNSLEKMGSEEQEGAKCDTVQNAHGAPKEESYGREQQPVDEHSSLSTTLTGRTQRRLKFSPAEKAQYAFVGSKPFRLHTEGDECPDDDSFKDSPSAYGSAFSRRIPKGRPQTAKNNFVKKNKQTLGLHTDKNKSYLQLHGKKEEVIQEQVTDTSSVKEEPVQSDLSDPNMKKGLEDIWNLNSQRLKALQSKESQRNKVKTNKNLKGGAFSRKDNGQPAGRPAGTNSLHRRHHQVSELQTAPVRAVKQGNSNALQKRLCPNPSVDPDTNTAANSDACLSNLPAQTSKKNKNRQRDCPNGLPHGQQRLHNHSTVPFFPRDGNTSSQAHPNQKKISFTFNANYQEMAKDQVSLQDCKRHTYATSTLRPSQASAHRSPPVFCTVSQLTQTVEQQHQEMLREHNDLQSFSRFPPLVPPIKRDSQVGPERGDGNQLKRSRRNSEGHLMQIEKQKQHKVCKKPNSSKAYINLDMKLGGLGPDYEAVKEKKERFKQRKEYAQRVNAHNMKNMTSVQNLPPVVSSTSRQKALDYAKMIPKPKTFAARQPDGEVKEEQVHLPALKRDSLPPITTLETLQSRHEKEKKVVAAFRTPGISEVLQNDRDIFKSKMSELFN